MSSSARRSIQRIAIALLSAARVYPTALTDSSRIRSLIKRLSPVTPGVALIRLGPASDGGYLVPDDLAGIEACFSPGVSLVSGFERDCAELGMKVFLADGSVAGPAESHPQFNFIRKYIGATTSSDFMTMDDWVHDSIPESQSDLLLQMDIEGGEYETILSMSDRLLRRFRIVVIEFHYLDHLWSKPFFPLVSSAFSKLLQTHTCVHIHPNNCKGALKKSGLEIPRIAEFTFLRTDRVVGRSYARTFPHPLDEDNTDKDHLRLPDCWIGKQ